MKELSIEEKAKAYDKALERARTWQNYLYEIYENDYADELNYIFPELAESEDEEQKPQRIVSAEAKEALYDKVDWNDGNERIRLDLINFFKNESFLFHKREEIIAWLEKQGEKTNPYSGISFEYNGHIWGMCARDNGVDILLDTQLFKHLEKQGEEKLPIEKLPEEMKTVGESLGFTTQDECDDYNKMVTELIMSDDDIEQKPTWSEEDERIYHSLLADIRASQNGSTNTLETYYNEQIEWLESIKERLKGE